ncbi:MAG: hypothetical protein ACP5DQ_11500 [Bacteroidales bacterium]
MKHFRWLLFIAVILLAFSCLDDAPDDFDNPESTWNPNFSFPVGYTSLGMNAESGFDTLLLELNPIDSLPEWYRHEIDITMSYAMPFDMQELSGFSEEILRLMVRINAYNGFPTGVTGQIYFLDINNYIVDSVFTDEPFNLSKGSVDENGRTSEKFYLQKDIEFPKERIDNLHQTRNILIKGKITNVDIDTSLVYFFPDYEVDVQVGVQVELGLSISGN